MKKIPVFLRLSVKITAMVILMVLTCAVLVGILVYQDHKAILFRLKGLTAQTAADTLASALGPREIQNLYSTEQENDYYYYLKKTLAAAGAHANLKFMYIISKAETGSDFKIICSQSGDGNFSLPLGYLESINMWNEASVRAYETGKHTYSEPYFDETYGVLMSGYAPVLDSQGNVIAVVGVDISLEDIIADIDAIRNTIILIVSIFVILFSVISIVYTKYHIGSPITALSRMSDNVLEGNLDYDANIQSTDEIGGLYDNFKKMQATIRDLVDSLYTVSYEHKNGDLNVAVDAGRFNGAYKAVAVGFNEFITDINTDVLETLDMFKRVSDGEFDVELPPRPGQKNYSNVVFDSVKETLKSVHQGISILVKNMADGEFLEGEEVSQYSGDWDPLMRKIVRFHLEAEKQRQIIVDGINYARKIQKDLLPKKSLFDKAFEDYSIIWEPKDIVGGDIYWLKNFDGGAVLCVCDCTGHGTPGALLTMLVVSAFEAVVNENNCGDTAEVIWQLEQRLVNVFSVNSAAQENGKTAAVQDGCDLAVLYISKDKSVTVSSGNSSVFVCDGKDVKRMRGQKIFVGEGKLKSKEDVKTIKIQYNPDNKFYIASDGLFDQIGGEFARPFGYKRFMEIIRENHYEEQPAISSKIWEAFENYRGEQARRDDVELITFKP